jgi:pimeloyl-ACP methyl ester carboxylesterase
LTRGPSSGKIQPSQTRFDQESAVAKHVGDVVVLLPGIMGSVLRKGSKDVWAPTPGAVLGGLITLGRDIKQLKLGDDPLDEEEIDDVTAPRLMPDIHLIPGLWKIDGYGRIRQWIMSNYDVREGVNYFEFPYDWRRDNRVHARRLAGQSADWLSTYRKDPKGNPKAKLVLVGHSMGGLISRYFLECLDGWRETRMLVTFGTPYRGSMNAVDSLANGVHKGVGPLSIDLSDFVRSMNSVYQLLPIYECVDSGDGKLIRPAEADAIPHVDAARAKAALDDFHHEISNAVDRHEQEDEYNQNRYEIRPVVGTTQPTAQSAKLYGGKLELLHMRGGKDEGGDGTVPRVSATPIEVEREANAMFAAQRHASLQDDDAVLIQLDGLLTGLGLDTSAVRALPGINLSLDLEDAYSVDEPVLVRAKPEATLSDPLVAVVADNTGAEAARGRLLLQDDEWYSVELPPLPAGAYRVTVSSENVKPVTDVFGVFPADG